MNPDATELPAWLAQASDEALDQLPFGVIGFDAAGRITRYNRYESQLSGLSPDRVMGKHLFTGVAPCMNNPLISGQFSEARDAGHGIDETIDYVLAFRIRPVPVRLRMLLAPGADSCYLVIRRADEIA